MISNRKRSQSTSSSSSSWSVDSDYFRDLQSPTNNYCISTRKEVLANSICLTLPEKRKNRESECIDKEVPGDKRNLVIIVRIVKIGFLFLGGYLFYDLYSNLHRLDEQYDILYEQHKSLLDNYRQLVNIMQRSDSRLRR